MKYTYLDNASTTQMLEEAYEFMLPYFKEKFENESSTYTKGKENKRVVDNAREIIANSIGANTREVYFTSSGTEANNWVLKGILKRGMQCITSKIEHPSILKTLEFLEREGVLVTYLPVDEYGIVSTRDLENAITKKTALISIMLVNNEIGTIQNIKELCSVAKKYNILFHTDAVSAFGHININLGELNVDFMTISAHKIYGPKGVGALYIKEGVVISPLLSGGNQERARRSGTVPVPLIAAFGKCTEIVVKGIDEEYKRITAISETFIQKVLKNIEGSFLNGSAQNRCPNIINVGIPNINGEDLIILLDKEGFMCSAGSACTAGSLETSHVITAIGRDDSIASLRVSLGLFNKEEHLDNLLQALIKVLAILK